MGAILAIDKVAGPTSFDVVRQIKRRLGKVKVGHTGSLDPFATGLLLILVGRATKLSNLLLNSDKTYEARMKLGVKTDSGDLTGETTAESDVPELSFEHIQSTFKGFEGRWEQTPPMFSAKKIDGVRLYELARKKIEVERKKVAVELKSVEAKAADLPFIEFEVSCSKGTYIRSLAEELGEKLGTVAHLSALRRTECGPFQISQSVLLETFLEDPKPYLTKGHETYRQFIAKERRLPSQPATERTRIANAP